MQRFTRRTAMAAFGGLALSRQGTAQAQKYPRNMSHADVEKLMEELSNWGKWGDDAAAGTINLITPAKRKAAAALVRDGISISLELDADLPKEGPTGGVLPSMTPGQGRGQGRGAQPSGPRTTWTLTPTPLSQEPPGGMAYQMDTIAVTYHGQATTHMDALSHLHYDGKMFNGHPLSSYTERGTTKNDVTAFKNGIFTRGVLFDMPRFKGVPYLGDDEPIYAEDLEAYEKKMGVRLEPGDAFLFRTGRWVRLKEKGFIDVGRTSPGLYVSATKWLKERGVALVGDDVDQDVMPSRIEGIGQPVHLVLLRCMGTPVIDNANLEELSDECARRRRWTFLLTVNPMRVPGATGSPVNPIATL